MIHDCRVGIGYVSDSIYDFLFEVPNSQLQKREEAGNELLCAEHSGIAWVDKFAKT